MKWTQPYTSPPARAVKPAGSRSRAGAEVHAATDCLDPYVRWAERTEWRGVRRLMGAGLGTGGELVKKLRVLVQAPPMQDQADFLTLLNDPRWEVAKAYKHHIPGTEALARHFTAEIEKSHLQWLKTNPGGISWELALPFRDAETAARAVQVGGTGPTRAADSYRPAKNKLFTVPPSKVAQGKMKSAIAVIDFGCPFLNTAFATKARAEHTTRVAALWDQGSHVPKDMATLWSDACWRMGYGRELSNDAINALLKAVRTEPKYDIDEAEAYRRIDYLIDYDDPRRRIWGATHGSHVLDVAGGCIDPLTGKPDVHASAAQLVFVQLPSLTGADSAGGSLSSQVLDAVRYVLDVCKGDARIVINLSYGSFAGPHDGSSLIEQALDELLAVRSENVAIVLGAGNARQAQCHQRRSVRKNRSALLQVDLPPGDYTDTFVEVWFDNAQHLALLKARVRSGEGDWSPAVALGGQVELLDEGDTRPVALLRFDERVPNGRKPLLLLALAPTARPADDDGPLACTGPWEIELFLDPAFDAVKALPEKNDVAIAFDAWVERDDPGWLGSGVQPRFSDPHFGDADECLSSLATGQYTIAVGGFRLDDGLPTAYSSSSKKNGQPLVYAACEEDALRPHVRAAGVRSGDSLRMNGTSVAAPLFARRLYNWMMAGNTLDTRDLAAAIKGVIQAQGTGDGEDLVRSAHKDEPAQAQRAVSKRP